MGDNCETSTCPGWDEPCNGHGSCNPDEDICTCYPGKVNIFLFKNISLKFYLRSIVLYFEPTI